MTETPTLSTYEIHNWMQGMLIQHVPISGTGLTTEEVIAPSERLSAAQHLSIYRQSYIARLRDCMKNQFRALAYALGELLFEAFADQYLDSNPSVSYTLNDLGKKFPSFLDQTRPDAGMDEKEDWPDFMIELAAFEFALSEIFDMANADNNEVPDFETPDDLLTVAPTLHLFGHQFPICRYYLDFNAGRSPELPLALPSHCAVSRQDYKLGLYAINVDQYCFLGYLKNGASVAEAKDRLAAAFHLDLDKVDHVWPIWRRHFIQSGFLVSL